MSNAFPIQVFSLSFEGGKHNVNDWKLSITRGRMYEGNTAIVSRWGIAMLSSDIVSVQDSNSDEVDTPDNISNEHPIALTHDTLNVDVQSLI